MLLTTDFSEYGGKKIYFVKKIKEMKEIEIMNVVRKGENKEEIEENVNEAKKRLVI